MASAAGFTDVAGNDHEVAINALADAGIINGYADGSFKPNQTINRGQVVKLLGRYLEAEGQEIPADWNTKQRFNDLPTSAEAELVKYAALAKDAGVFNGSNGNLNATQTMQRQQMAVVLVRAIKEIAGVDLVADYKKAGFVTEISDLEKAYSAEQRSAIVALEYAGITNVSNFNPGNSVTRGQFASFLYRTIENVINAPVAGVVGIKAINATTVEVTFDEEVENVQALHFLISDLEVKNAAVKQSNKKVVVLTTAAQTADKEYTVSLGEDKIGTFKGIAAVVPTKVDIVEKSVQGKLGQQVTVKAQVTVVEGQSKAGVPVTFFIPGSTNGVKTPVTVEAVTDENGVASYTYTRYAATNDTVTVYANGDRSKFSTGYVFWGVDTILTITEVTEGSTINNGANKTYKVTYKHPETGRPVSGKVLNVSVKENIDVTVDKLQNVTVNGVAVVQTSENNTRAAQITTDSKGEATFTVSGSNAQVTPVVFEATPVTVNNANGTVTTTGYTQKYTADTLQASAGKVTFGAIQAAYTLELTRDGGEVAATGVENGRKYKLVVKNKDGKAAANEIVNVAFNENIDGVISTVTSAKFVKVENGKQVYDADKITVTTDSKGEASFIIASNTENSYATPIAWIDINDQTGKNANLDKGEPSAVGQMSYFQAPYVDGSKLVSSKKGTATETDKFVGGDIAIFKVQLTNQSGKVMPNSGYSISHVSYTVHNTGANNVKVGEVEIAPNRVYTVSTPPNGEIEVTTVNSQTSSVKVIATGVAKQNNGNKEFAFTAKEATATFTNADEITNPYTGILDLTSINKKDKEIKFAGKSKAVAYAGESGKAYKYFTIGNSRIANADAFIALLEEYRNAGKSVRATYEVKEDEVTFTIISVNDGTGTTPASIVERVNNATTVEQVRTAIQGLANYAKLTDENKTKAANDIFIFVSTGQAFTTPASLNLLLETYFIVDVNATYTAATIKADGEKAVGIYTDNTVDNLLKIESAAGETAYNDFKIVFETNTTVGTSVTTAYNRTQKILTVKLPVSSYDTVTGAATIDKTNATFENIKTKIEEFNNGALSVTLTGFTGDASKLVGQTITLTGATPATEAVPGKLVLTFSEAIATAPTALTFNNASTLGTGATFALSEDKKTVTITLGTNANILAGTTITGLTGIEAVVKTQTFKTPITITGISQ
ncbi:S-layer homology domain-containing protein [Lysinibacillus sp. 38-6]|uniref:S-layer homology domain-containing protein n=1 Tax=Lysinibacillus sp. 38-6 TaxID=3385991 RepID=UPI0039089108